MVLAIGDVSELGISVLEKNQRISSIHESFVSNSFT